MAMARYNIYLAELPNWGLNLRNAYAPIRSTLQGWFDQIVKKASGFDDCWVQWCGNAPGSIQPHELLVYFISSKSSTLTKAFGSTGSLGPNGTTTFKKGGECLSEVYVSGNQGDAKGLAALAFHELMHNKLRMQGELHGAQGGGGLAYETVTAATKLTDQNRDLMAAKLGDKAPQWLGGWMAAADPLSDAGK